jgi:predicted nucleic acid-binding protein
VNVLVDTSVWSLALRRRPGDLSVIERNILAELNELVREGRAEIIGPIRQELLSGIKFAEQYERVRNNLRPFLDEPIDTNDFEAAARASNECRSRGIVVSVADILMCTVAIDRRWSIFTMDPDFKTYARILPITLHSPRS